MASVGLKFCAEGEEEIRMEIRLPSVPPSLPTTAGEVVEILPERSSGIVFPLDCRTSSFSSSSSAKDIST